MSDAPQTGTASLGHLFIRNVQTIVPDKLWIAEGQRGATGKGKVWRPTLIGEDGGVRFRTLGQVNPCHGYKKGMFIANLTLPPMSGWLEGYFYEETKAVEFLIREGKHFHG